VTSAQQHHSAGRAPFKTPPRCVRTGPSHSQRRRIAAPAVPPERLITQINLSRVLLAAGRAAEARDVAVAALALALGHLAHAQGARPPSRHGIKMTTHSLATYAPSYSRDSHDGQNPGRSADGTSG